MPRSFSWHDVAAASFFVILIALPWFFANREAILIRFRAAAEGRDGG